MAFAGATSAWISDGPGAAAHGEAGHPAQTRELPEPVLALKCVYPVGAEPGTRPSCSSIESRSNIRLNETCLPSRKRSTWM
jgi:hypothetical protein